jgi:membrane-bound lytic murein transglycosylase B
LNNTLKDSILMCRLLVVALTCLPLLLPGHALASKKSAVRKAALAKSYTYQHRKDAMAFADDVAQQQGLDRDWVRQTIGEARFMPAIQQQMQPAGHGFIKNWNAYRSRFIEPHRIETGVAFWRNNADALTRSGKEYGVPPEVIVGIIGVETIYGQHMGSYRVIDALATLA